MNNDIKDFKYINKEFYNDTKEILEQARKRVYRNIQSEMVLAYWQIGKMIVEKQGGVGRALYGDGLVKELSIQMTNDFGKGNTRFDASVLGVSLTIHFPSRYTFDRWMLSRFPSRSERSRAQISPLRHPMTAN